jgi:putative ABC transport system ATP-binding protein
MALIELSHAAKEYRNRDLVTPVLSDVSLSIDSGEFLSLMGPSGSGKSTLMHILGFLDTLSSGQYVFGGKEVSLLSDLELANMRNERVGFVFQSFNLLPRATALENVMLPLVYAHIPEAERKTRATDVLESLGLSHRLTHTPDMLSGGEKQRVAIARALVNTPDIIFADEPTGNLDSKSGLEVMRIFQTLHASGNTIVLVTHEHDTALFADRMVQIRDGRILQDGPVSERRMASELAELSK